MSDTSSEYCVFILNKFFGEASSIVTRLIRIKGPTILPDILKDCAHRLNHDQVCRCILSLIRHSVLVINPGTVVKYKLNCEALFCLPRLPIFCKLVFHFYGKTAEELMLLLTMMGRASLRELLSCCLKRQSIHTKMSSEQQHEYIETLSNSITTLIKTNVLQIIDPKSWSYQVNESVDNNSVQINSFPRPAISKDDICDTLHRYVAMGCVNWPGDVEAKEPTRKRLKHSDDSSETTDFLKFVVCPNIHTLETMWRDRLICQLASEKLGEVCGDILSHLLCIATAASRNTEITSSESGAVSRQELTRSLRTVSEYFTSYLSLLNDDDDEVKFLLQKPGLGGYMYSCHFHEAYKHVIRQLLVKHIEYIIQVIFENGGLRIFRLLLSSGPLNLEEIERKVLLAQADFRRLLPRMVSMGLITKVELSRTKDYTAETIYCLYSVDLAHLARFMIELAQHTILRVSARRDYEFAQKKRLIEHRYRLECLILQHQDRITELSSNKNTTNDSELTSHRESVEALKSCITPAELEQLTVLLNKLSKLITCEHDCQVAWFIADLYLRLHS